MTEYRAQLGYGPLNRNPHLIDYPFGAAAEMHQCDSVTYIRTYSALADQPRSDTLYTYFRNGEHRKCIPLTVDQLDTTRQVLPRLRFGVVRHSPG